eukprot:703718-Pelagomonas_calceolata.AAC.1
MAVLDIQFTKLPGWSCAASYFFMTSHTVSTQCEAHALLVCRDADVCASRRTYAYLFNCFS